MIQNVCENVYFVNHKSQILIQIWINICRIRPSLSSEAFTGEALVYVYLLVCHNRPDHYKIPGHYYVDLLGATFSIIPMKRGRREVNLFLLNHFHIFKIKILIAQKSYWGSLIPEYSLSMPIKTDLIEAWIDDGHKVQTLFFAARFPTFELLIDFMIFEK